MRKIPVRRVSVDKDNGSTFIQDPNDIENIGETGRSLNIFQIIRDFKGLDVKQVAEAVGCSVQTYKKLEAGLIRHPDESIYKNFSENIEPRLGASSYRFLYQNCLEKVESDAKIKSIFQKELLKAIRDFCKNYQQW